MGGREAPGYPGAREGRQGPGPGRGWVMLPLTGLGHSQQAACQAPVCVDLSAAGCGVSVERTKR